MGAKGKKNLTEKEFEQIKLMESADLKTGQIKQLTGRTWNTLAAIRKARDFADYKVVVARRYKPQTPPIMETPLISHEDIKLLLIKLDEVKEGIDILVGDLEKRQSNEKVNNWKFGRSR